MLYVVALVCLLLVLYSRRDKSNLYLNREAEEVLYRLNFNSPLEVERELTKHDEEVRLMKGGRGR